MCEKSAAQTEPLIISEEEINIEQIIPAMTSETDFSQQHEDSVSEIGMVRRLLRILW